MVTDISWWALDGCCYFLVGSAGGHKYDVQMTFR